MLGIQNEREWVTFCNGVLSQPNLAIDPRFSSNSQRTRNRDELKSIIHDVFSEFRAEETIARLDEASIANASVNDMKKCLGPRSALSTRAVDQGSKLPWEPSRLFCLLDQPIQQKRWIWRSNVFGSTGWRAQWSHSGGAGSIKLISNEYYKSTIIHTDNLMPLIGKWGHTSFLLLAGDIVHPNRLYPLWAPILYVCTRS